MGQILEGFTLFSDHGLGSLSSEELLWQLPRLGLDWRIVRLETGRS